MAETKINANQTSITASDIGAIQNTATGTGAITILGTPTSAVKGIAIGAGASVGNPFGIAIGGYSTNTLDSGIAIGQSVETNGNGIAIGGNGTQAKGGVGTNSIAIGISQKATASGAIQIGTGGSNNNTDSYTFKVGFLNGNYELLSADGTIPEARLADTTNAAQGQVLTLDSNLNAVWAAPGGGGASSATATLAVNDWSSNTQTVNVTGVTASNNVIVAAAPASQADYTSAGILCTAQGAGTLSFSCQTVPTNAIIVNILIL